MRVAIRLVRAFIREAWRQGISTAELGRRAGVDDKTVRLAMRPGWDPLISTLTRMSRMVPAGWRSGDPIVAAPLVGNDPPRR
jgi:hypothetical protein